ncbi:STAS domain-containing protein [Wenjunlia tyrosinilytica]|uniref:Anti-sigma factor antagonist n=1 Tax=Wenjunlia tyrosinilytica TaxID=1544741 RepID=A0A917ZUH3_9ACTN|nr:STAS domain-containing protein [Wenjunlia tyrosinilytica]GGO92499.1 hypothetical protein GCM10012280_42820 [Wenjunlia tyrosinilytica]
MSRFPVVTGTADGSTVVELSGDIDLLTAPTVARCIDAVTRNPHPRVVLDLRPVTFMDCRGMSLLVRARRRIRERAGMLVVVTDDSRILRTMRTTGLLESFVVHSELRSALAAVSSPLRNPAASA